MGSVLRTGGGGSDSDWDSNFKSLPNPGTRLQVPANPRDSTSSPCENQGFGQGLMSPYGFKPLLAGGERSLEGLTLGSEDALGGDTRGAGGRGGSVAARALRGGERLALGLGLAGETRRGTEGLTCRRGCAL